MYLAGHCMLTADWLLSGEVKVTLTDANGVAVPFKLVDNKDKTYRVEFQASVVGVCTATVMYANQPATGSPYKINVEAAVDLSKVQVNGLPESKSLSTMDYHG